MLIPPQSPFRNKWVAGTTLAVVLLLAAFMGQCAHYKKRATQLADDVAVAQAELAGAHQALLVKPREVIKIVERDVPRDVIKLVEKKVLVPVVSGTVTSDPQPIPIPLPHLEPGLEQIEVGVALNGWFLITTTAQGTPMWDGAITTRLVTKDWAKDVPFTKANSTIDVRFNEDITKALRDHASERRIAFKPRPVRQWRAGWVAGGGLSYDPFRQELAPAVFVGYGLQF